MEPTANEPKPKRAYKKRMSKTDAEKAIVQLQVTHKIVKKDILTALKQKECRPGTNSRLAYLRALQSLEIDFVENMVKLGALPKNIAAQTTTSYQFKAHVSKGGGVQTVAVSDKQLSEIERTEGEEYRKGVFESPEDEALRAQLQAEFGDAAVQPEKE